MVFTEPPLPVCWAPWLDFVRFNFACLISRLCVQLHFLLRCVMLNLLNEICISRQSGSFLIGKRGENPTQLPLL